MFLSRLGEYKDDDDDVVVGAVASKDDDDFDEDSSNGLLLDTINMTLARIKGYVTMVATNLANKPNMNASDMDNLDFFLLVPPGKDSKFVLSTSNTV